MFDASMKDFCKVEIRSRNVGHLAVHRSLNDGSDRFQVTDIKSGRSMVQIFGGGYDHFEDAVAAAERVDKALSNEEWERMTPDADPEFLNECRDRLQAAVEMKG